LANCYAAFKCVRDSPTIFGYESVKISFWQFPFTWFEKDN